MRIIVYVDGFNLYYRALKGTSYRWLNLAEMCRLLLPSDEICAIKYFTAMVQPRPGDPDQPTRQKTYLRALRTTPSVRIILGSFLTHEVMMPLAPPAIGYARVIKTEEKGSDVNLATHLLMHGFQGAYETAVVVSNDSDLLLPIQVVTRQLGKEVGLLMPQKHPSRALVQNAAFAKRIRPGVLAKCQFDHELRDRNGIFCKPASW